MLKKVGDLYKDTGMGPAYKDVLFKRNDAGHLVPWQGVFRSQRYSIYFRDGQQYDPAKEKAK